MGSSLDGLNACLSAAMVERHLAVYMFFRQCAVFFYFRMTFANHLRAAGTELVTQVLHTLFIAKSKTPIWAQCNLFLVADECSQLGMEDIMYPGQQA